MAAATLSKNSSRLFLGHSSTDFDEIRYAGK
jgi:hypothetical protein